MSEQYEFCTSLSLMINHILKVKVYCSTSYHIMKLMCIHSSFFFLYYKYVSKKSQQWILNKLISYKKISKVNFLKGKIILTLPMLARDFTFPL